MKNFAAVFWSGGKDSAMALGSVLNDKEFEVKYLVTAISKPQMRVTMHGLKEELIKKQSEAIGIPLIRMYMEDGSNTEYEQKLKEVFLKLKNENINTIIYGDIFLEDLKMYRENILKVNGMCGLYPLWKQNSKDLINKFLKDYKAVICCGDAAFFSEEDLGKEIDQDFSDNLPVIVDPCGENGEFHTFCFDAPYFKNPVRFIKGEIVLRSYLIGDYEKKFRFAEILPD